VRYEDRELHVSQQPPPPAAFIERVPPMAAPPVSSPDDERTFHPPIDSVIDTSLPEGLDQFGPASDFVRVTDEQ
jgi:hypothetical protein